MQIRGMDSLDAYELGYAIEEQYGVSFTDSEIASWVTFRDVLDMARAKAGDPPLPRSDRLALIEARWRERGCPDGDFTWLLAECRRLRKIEEGANAFRRSLSEVLNSGDGVYRP